MRLVTAGTLTEEALLNPRRANVLVALAELRGTIGIAACDVSTGAMVLEECAPEMLGAALARDFSERSGGTRGFGRMAPTRSLPARAAPLPATPGPSG